MKMTDKQKIKELEKQLNNWKKSYSQLATKLANINRIVKRNLELIQ